MIMLKKIYEDICAFFNIASPLVWPLKMICAAFLSVITGSGILTFLLENAMYNYALTFGFRPPLDGIELVQPIVAVANIQLIFAAAILVGTTSIILKIYNYAMKHRSGVEDEENLPKKFQRTRPLYAIPLIIAFSAVNAVLIQAILHWTVSNFSSASSLYILSRAIPIGILAFLIAISTAFMVWRPQFSFVGTAAIVLIYYTCTGAVHLPPYEVARQLRIFGYGGGTEIIIEIAKHGERSQSFKTHLLARSDKWIIIYNEVEKEIIEVPVSEVKRITLKEGGLRNIGFRLPAKVAAPYGRSDSI